MIRPTHRDRDPFWELTWPSRVIRLAELLVAAVLIIGLVSTPIVGFLNLVAGNYLIGAPLLVVGVLIWTALVGLNTL